jgi:hypothetical protein
MYKDLRLERAGKWIRYTNENKDYVVSRRSGQKASSQGICLEALNWYG